MTMKSVWSFVSRHRRVFLVIILIQVFAVFLLATESGFRRDEKVHSKVIKRIYRENPERVANLTNIPGYHYVIAYTARAVDTVYDFGKNPKQRQIRYMSVTIFGTAFVLAVCWVLRVLHKREDELFVILTMPLVFLFTFLVYTDIPALATFFAGYALLMRRRHLAAAVAFGATLLIRQDMILFIGGLVGISMMAQIWGEQKANSTKKKLTAILVDSGGAIKKFAQIIFSWAFAPYYLVFAGFIAFVIINGGVAVGDTGAHPPMKFYWGNIYAFFITFAIVYLPLIVAHFAQIARAVRRHWLVVLPVAIVGWFFYQWSFVVEHAYNFVPGFLHNDILIAIISSPIVMLLAYFATLLVIGTLSVMRWRDNLAMILFAGISLVSLSLHWLIEPRYVMVPLIFVAIWHIWSRKLIWAQIAYGVALSTLVYFYFIAQDSYFL